MVVGKPADEDMEIAAHAVARSRIAILASKRKFPTFSNTSKSNTLLFLKMSRDAMAHCHTITMQR